jgi:hypothetical protein
MKWSPTQRDNTKSEHAMLVAAARATQTLAARHRVWLIGCWLEHLPAWRTWVANPLQQRLEDSSMISLWYGVLGVGEETFYQAPNRTRRDDPATGVHIALSVASSFNCNMSPPLEEG